MANYEPHGGDERKTNSRRGESMAVESRKRREPVGKGAPLPIAAADESNAGLEAEKAEATVREEEHAVRGDEGSPRPRAGPVRCRPRNYNLDPVARRGWLPFQVRRIDGSDATNNEYAEEARILFGHHYEILRYTGQREGARHERPHHRRHYRLVYADFCPGASARAVRAHQCDAKYIDLGDR